MKWIASESDLRNESLSALQVKDESAFVYYSGLLTSARTCIWGRRRHSQECPNGAMMASRDPVSL